MTTLKTSLITAAPAGLAALQNATEARVALGRSGAGLPTRVAQTFLLDHARAREAVWSPLDTQRVDAELRQIGFTVSHATSDASDRAEYLRRPDKGRRLSDVSRTELNHCPSADIVIVVADGLSATAIDINAVAVLGLLAPLLEKAGFGPPSVVVATQARVALGDEIGATFSAKAVIVLIGERPGLSAADSLSAYITFAPSPGLPDSRRNCISNIREGGLLPAFAVKQIADMLSLMFKAQNSGITLDIADTGLATIE